MNTHGKPSGAPLIPWDDVMAFGLGVLRLAPESFWSMTPRELRAAAYGRCGRTGNGPLTRAALGDLMARFPDGRNT